MVSKTYTVLLLVLTAHDPIGLVLGEYEMIQSG